MIRRRSRLALTLALMLVALPVTLTASDSGSYQEAWQALKQLSGTWQYTTVGRDHEPQAISYHVTSRGSVVFEEFLGSTPDGVRSMATAYHLDVDDLVATHYCGAGNQPRMRAASWDAEQRILHFDYWDITHLADPDAYYTTDIELRFEDDDRVQLRFRGRQNGEPQDWQIHKLERLSSRPFERPAAESTP